MKEKPLHVLFLGDPETASHLNPIATSLASFAIVRVLLLKHGQSIIYSRYLFLRVVYRLWESFYFTLRIFKEGSIFRADILLTQYVFHYGLIAGIAAKLLGKPSVVQAIGSDLKVEPEENWVNFITVRLTFKITSGVICVSRDLESIARDLGAKNTVVIPTPLDLTDFPSKSKNHIGGKRIITVASLHAVKGISYLIKAMMLLENEKLLIIGDGGERVRLERLSRDLGLADRVFFLGHVYQRSEIWNNLQQSTVFVLPSLSEGCPRALLEAMACGLPVVATNVGGIPEIVTDGINGLLVPPKDEVAIAKAIRRVLDDLDFQRISLSRNKENAMKYVLPTVCQAIYDYLRTIAFAKP